MIADFSISVEDFTRDNSKNAFIIGAKSSLIKAKEKGEKYGVLFTIPRNSFCVMTEKMMGWTYDGDTNTFCVICGNCQFGDKPETLLCHVKDYQTSTIATLDEETNSWILEREIAFRWIKSLADASELTGISKEAYNKIVTDLRCEEAK